MQQQEGCCLGTITCAEVSENSAVDYPSTQPYEANLQVISQSCSTSGSHAQELARSEGSAQAGSCTSLTQQLDQADNQAAAHALLQERCAELQWHIDWAGRVRTGAGSSGYSALEREHAQVQDRLDAQLEVIAEKATQQQQDLATALGGLQAGQAAQQAANGGQGSGWRSKSALAHVQLDQRPRQAADSPESS